MVTCRSQIPRGLRRRSAAARLLRLWVRISPGAWMSVYCECCVLLGRGLCDGLITRPEESYRLWCVVVYDLETSRMRRPWPALGRSTTKWWFFKMRLWLIALYIISVLSFREATMVLGLWQIPTGYYKHSLAIFSFVFLLTYPWFDLRSHVLTYRVQPSGPSLMLFETCTCELLTRRILRHYQWYVRKWVLVSACIIKYETTLWIELMCVILAIFMQARRSWYM